MNKKESNVEPLTGANANPLEATAVTLSQLCISDWPKLFLLSSIIKGLP